MTRRQRIQKITRHFPYWCRPSSIGDAVMFGMGAAVAVWSFFA